MLQTGEYTTYKEFGLDLIQELEDGGFTEAIQNGEQPKSKSLETPQGIILKYFGFKAIAGDTNRRLKRSSYDCLIQYQNEDVTFETICREIIRKCSETNNEIHLVKNIMYVFLRTMARQPLTSSDIFLKEYFIHDGKLKKISKVRSGVLTYDIIEEGVNLLNEVLIELDRIGKYTFQELVNIISYIAIIEEFNYPKIQGRQYYRGRADCFGRYIEVLLGDDKELDKLLGSKAFKNGAQFVHREELEKWYLTDDIELDRIEFDVNKNYF